SGRATSSSDSPTTPSRPCSRTSARGQRRAARPRGRAFSPGGAVGDVAPDATAFVHRRDWLLSTIDLGWSADDPEARVLESLEWLDAFHEAMTPFTSRESYQNFID